MKIDNGFLTIGSYRGTPVRVHWTTPIGAFVLSGCEVRPGAWLAFFLLVVCHELGHAMLVRRYRFHVLSIDIHAVGGSCRWSGVPSDRQRAVVAWGGILGQAVLLVLGLAVSPWRVTMRPFFQDLARAFVETNLALALLNLLPIRPFDGAEAWSLLRTVSVRKSALDPRGWWKRARIQPSRRRKLSADPETPLTFALLEELERRRERHEGAFRKK